MADKRDYLIEFLHQTFRRDPAQGLQLWSTTFDELRTSWQVDACRRMLREVKVTTFSPTVLILVRAAEGMLEAQLEQWEEAVACYQQALSAVQGVDDPASEAWLLSNLGNIYYLAGDLAGSEQSFEQALGIYRNLNHDPGVARTLTNLASVYRDSGRLTEAAACYQEALERQDQADLAAVILANLGAVYQMQQRYPEADTFYQKAIGLFQALGDQHGEAQAWGNLGTLYLAQNQLEEARGCFLHDLELMRQTGDLNSQAKTLNNLALLYRRLGDEETAQQLSEQSRALRPSADR